MPGWTQLWVRGPHEQANTPQAMKRVDEHIQTAGGLFAAPDGTPIREADGTYEVRVLFGDPGYVKFILTKHYGLEVVREVRHDE